MKKFSALLASAAVIVASAALAAPGGGERHNPDADGDGIITRAEVDADVARRFARMDVNKDGKLDQADREAAMAERAKKRGGEPGRMARGDANGDGAISADEMRLAAMARFDRADANKDGQLTAAEREAARPKRGLGEHDRVNAPTPGE